MNSQAAAPIVGHMQALRPPPEQVIALLDRLHRLLTAADGWVSTRLDEMRLRRYMGQLSDDPELPHIAERLEKDAAAGHAPESAITADRFKAALQERKASGAQ